MCNKMHKIRTICIFKDTLWKNSVIAVELQDGVKQMYVQIVKSTQIFITKKNKYYGSRHLW